jgi:hypothetical protein
MTVTKPQTLDGYTYTLESRRANTRTLWRFRIYGDHDRELVTGRWRSRRLHTEAAARRVITILARPLPIETPRR